MQEGNQPRILLTICIGEAVSFEALKAIESCSGAAFDASLLLPTEEALEYFLALDRPSWPAVGSLAMVSDDRLR